MSLPRIGMFGINFGVMSEPSTMAAVAQACEDTGYDSVWTGEHIVLPDPQAPPSPAAPATAFVDSAASLSFLAATTTTIKLGTGIVILPQRQPAVLAKSLASVDHLSGGRLMFGLGVGYLEPEMTACSTPMARRGERADEYLEAMRLLWTTDAASFDGEFVAFSGVTANPKPIQADLHTVVGGHSQRAAQRAVAHGHGWYGFMRDPETAAGDLLNLRTAADQVERPDHLGELEISITPARRLTREDVTAYAELGVHRIIVQPGRSVTTPEDLMAFVDANAPHNW
ncbi:MAG: putative F420-dependent oxidoreductase [Candidatus Poriferisodalaceae bacterium]|jgi:probable F420-dependent oxidoreductase